MSRFATRHAIIIGGGASGVLLAYQLLQNHEFGFGRCTPRMERTAAPNTRAGLDFLGKLKTEELAKIIACEEFSVSSRGGDAPPLVKEALACFSDQDDISKVLDNGNLLARGVSLFASRANAIFDSDSFIAILAKEDRQSRHVRSHQ
jgi:hypothetical protein